MSPSYQALKPKLASLVVVVSASAACQLVLGLEDRVELTADAGSEEGPGPTDPCGAVGVPLRPSTPDDEIAGDYVFALSRIDRGLDGGLPFAVNLDRVCTCPGPPSCVARAMTSCDGDGGSDNATSVVLDTLARSGAFSEAALNDDLRTGISGALLRVQGYGGKPDDPHVVASFYGSLGFEGARPTGQPEDRWSVDEGSLSPDAGDTPRFADPNAYVSGGVLVASFDFPVDVGGDGMRQAPLRLDLRGGFVVAAIDPGEGVLRGVIAGRWPVESLLRTVETLPDPLRPDAQACRGTTSFELVRKLVCGAVDITADPRRDRSTAACDALSTSIGFVALRAQLGRARSRTAAGIPCGEGPPPGCE